jgi:hypothetical protein
LNAVKGGSDEADRRYQGFPVRRAVGLYVNVVDFVKRDSPSTGGTTLEQSGAKLHTHLPSRL